MKSELEKQPLQQALDSVKEELEPQKLLILTEQLPPFNYVENGKLVGISTEIVQEILIRLNMNIPIICKSDWKKAYNMVLEKPNTMIFSIAKIKQRENKFKWVGAINTTYWELFSREMPLTDNNLTGHGYNGAKKATVGILDTGAIYYYLKDKGFTNLIASASNMENAKKFIDGKVQLWGASELTALAMLRQLQVRPNILHVECKLKKHKLYMGFNIKTSDSMVDKFQTTLDQMKHDGTYDKIINKYYNKLHIENKKNIINNVLHNKISHGEHPSSLCELRRGRRRTQNQISLIS